MTLTLALILAVAVIYALPIATLWLATEIMEARREQGAYERLRRWDGKS